MFDSVSALARSKAPTFLASRGVVESKVTASPSRGVGGRQHDPDRRLYDVDFYLVSPRSTKNRQING